MPSLLFPHNIPFGKSNEELDKIKEDFKNLNLDEYFLCSAAIKKHKDFFEGLYEIYQPYADNNFLKEIQIQFHQRIWEMYLGVIMLRHKKKLLKPAKKDNKVGIADIRIDANKIIHIECVATNHGIKDDKVPKIQYSRMPQDVPDDKILLRVASSLNDKFAQYQRRLEKGIIQDDEPYIIALSNAKLDWVEDRSMPRVLQASLAFGNQQLKMLDGSGNRLDEPISSRQSRPAIVKENGEPVDMQFLLNPAHSGISAIIYTNDSVLRSLEQTTELHIIHNHLARNPISLSEFDFLVQYYKDENSDILLTK